MPPIFFRIFPQLIVIHTVKAESLFLTVQYWKKVILCLISENSIILLPLFFYTELQHGVLLTQQTAVVLLLSAWKHVLFALLRRQRTRCIYLVYLGNCKGKSSINVTGFELFLWQLNFIIFFPSVSLSVKMLFSPLSITTLSHSSYRQRFHWSEEKFLQSGKAKNWTWALLMCVETEGRHNLFRQNPLKFLVYETLLKTNQSWTF